MAICPQRWCHFWTFSEEVIQFSLLLRYPMGPLCPKHPHHWALCAASHCHWSKSSTTWASSTLESCTESQNLPLPKIRGMKMFEIFSQKSKIQLAVCARKILLASVATDFLDLHLSSYRASRLLLRGVLSFFCSWSSKVYKTGNTLGGRSSESRP